jgi:hypothetical protein
MRLSDPRWRWAAPAALAAILGLGACASSPPPPTQEIASARAAISRAQQDGAAQLAPQPLRTAQDKLAMAQSQSSTDTAAARRSAEQAEVDADLAAATARARRAETTAADLASARSNLQQRQQLSR